MSSPLLKPLAWELGLNLICILLQLTSVKATMCNNFVGVIHLQQLIPPVTISLKFNPNHYDDFLDLTRIPNSLQVLLIHLISFLQIS